MKNKRYFPMFIDLSDKKIVVVGGGNVAIDAARISSRCIDAKISMFCLEAREKMPASNELSLIHI